METCECDGVCWRYAGGLAAMQSWADLLIAFAYFSIPLEMLYFASMFEGLPQRGTLVQFVSFILLCGCTHFIGARGLYLSLSDRMIVMAVFAKAATALVSCMTAISLLREIPRFLRTREREHHLTTKNE
jgi:ethylene receptor